MTDRLDTRTLNRTTLQRQGLLERSALSGPEVIERLVGLQAQNPLDPYYALWSRIDGFQPETVAAKVAEGGAVRGQSLRGTIHLHTRSDWIVLRPLFDQLCARILGSTQYGKDTRDIDRQRLLVRARELMDEAPRTRAEIGPALTADFPGVPAASLAQVATFLLPVVQVPPRGVWGKTGPSAWRVLDPGDLDHPDGTSSNEELVFRYLRAFGPASVKDLRVWSGLTGLTSVVDGLRQQLRAYKDENGVVLLDIEDGTIVPSDTPAPVRFLPEYDNVLLGHANRSRFFDNAGPIPPGWVGNLLVDGIYAGHWKLGKEGLGVTLQRKVTSRQRREVTEEAERLLVLTGRADLTIDHDR